MRLVLLELACLPLSITQPASESVTAPPPRRDVLASLLSGFRLHCPNCRQGKILKSYLGVNDRCPVCGEALFHHRADDAPAYFTILIVGHIVLPTMLVALELMPSPSWIHFVVWPLVAITLTWFLLPRIKGALISLQWALRMHGFASADEGVNLVASS